MMHFSSLASNVLSVMGHFLSGKFLVDHTGPAVCVMGSICDFALGFLRSYVVEVA